MLLAKIDFDSMRPIIALILLIVIIITMILKFLIKKKVIDVSRFDRVPNSSQKTMEERIREYDELLKRQSELEAEMYSDFYAQDNEEEYEEKSGEN